MPILDLQRRLREVGRIRIGQTVDTPNGKKRPEKLGTFRLTSPDEAVIKAAAAQFGGEARTWGTSISEHQWEVITDTDRLEVVVPPTAMAFSQFYETWTGGGCVRRCDGQRELIADQACACDPENRECKPHTRLSVMLPDLPAVGLWRLDTSGYYAAEELAGSVDLALAFAERGTYLPAELRLEQREKRRPGEQVKRFAVPILDLKVSMRALGAGVTSTPAVIEAPFTPVPVAELAAPPSSTVAEQLDVQPRERRGTQVPIPSTGVKPHAQPVEEEPPPPPPPDDEGDHGTQFNPNPRAVIACNQAGLGDFGRHALVAEITNGRTESSNDLTGPELLELDRRCFRIRLERLGDLGKREWKAAGLPALERLTPQLTRTARELVDELERLDRESF
jgi:hypothetical protein